jgi:hypothetical protein
MIYFIAVLATAPPSGRIVTEVGLTADVGDVINSAKFHVDRWTAFCLARTRKSYFPKESELAFNIALQYRACM